MPAQLDDASIRRIAESATAVDRIVAAGETVYGVNIGFGLLANTRIPDALRPVVRLQQQPPSVPVMK